MPKPENPQNLNRYSYVSNNPVKKIDPSGHRECYGYAPSNQHDMGNGVGVNSCAGGEWNAVHDEMALGKMQDQVRAAANGACGPDTFGGRLVEGLEFAASAAYCSVSPLSCVAGGAIGYAGYRAGNSVGNFIAGERDPKAIWENGVNDRDAELAIETGALGLGRGILGSGLLSGVQYSAGQVMKGKPVNGVDLIATTGLGSLSASISGVTNEAVKPFLPQAIRGFTENAAIPILIDNGLTVARSAFQDLLSHLVLDPIKMSMPLQ